MSEKRIAHAAIDLWNQDLSPKVFHLLKRKLIDSLAGICASPADFSMIRKMNRCRAFFRIQTESWFGGWADEGLYGLFHKQPIEPGMFNEGEAAKIHPEMHLDPELDFVVGKTCHSAFAPGSSRLESLLSGLNRRQLIFGGAAANLCVESTARDAMRGGCQVIVWSDTAKTFAKFLHEASLLNVKLFFCDLRSVSEITRQIGESETFSA